MKFRKKPVVVDAIQWFKNGDHPLDYSRSHDGLENGELRQFSPEERKSNGWEGDIVRYFRDPDVASDTRCKHCGNTMHFHGWIDTLEGGHIVCPGDWIITGAKGEHYPCKPDIFEATYEPEQDCAVKDLRDKQPQQQAGGPCLTCNDNGAVGNILNAEPCPDCTPQHHQIPEGYKLVSIEPVVELSDAQIAQLAYEHCDDTDASGEKARFRRKESIITFARALLAKYANQ